MGEWTLFSNHGHVLVCLANNFQARLRDVAAEVGITERAVQNILRELQSSGIVQVSKHGRCNHYQINTRKSLRHPLEAHCSVGKLLQLLKAGADENPALEVAVEPKSRSSKTRAAARPDKAQSSAMPIPVVVGAQTIAPEAKGAAAGKVPAAPPSGQSVPESTESEAHKTAKKASRDEKKNIPPSNQQGSLF